MSAKQKRKPTILFAFADSNRLGEVLSDLITEMIGIQKVFQNSDDFRIEIIDKVNVEKLIRILQQERNREDLVGFHFAGHAGDKHLIFEDRVNGEKLANILGTRKNLKFAFLNGCGTRPLVEAFHRAGIEYVIATNRKVEDKIAADFSVQFYREAIIPMVSILDAFFFAANSNPEEAADEREIKLREDIELTYEEATDNDFPWGLYPKQGSKDQLSGVYLNQGPARSFVRTYSWGFLLLFLLAVASFFAVNGFFGVNDFLAGEPGIDTLGIDTLRIDTMGVDNQEVKSVNAPIEKPRQSSKKSSYSIVRIDPELSRLVPFLLDSLRAHNYRISVRGETADNRIYFAGYSEDGFIPLKGKNEGYYKYYDGPLMIEVNDDLVSTFGLKTNFTQKSTKNALEKELDELVNIKLKDPKYQMEIWKAIKAKIVPL